MPLAPSVPAAPAEPDTFDVCQKDSLEQWPAGREPTPEALELVAYCHSGSRSELAAEILRSLGYRASNYRGSWHEWSRDESLPAELG